MLNGKSLKLYFNILFPLLCESRLLLFLYFFQWLGLEQKNPIFCERSFETSTIGGAVQAQSAVGFGLERMAIAPQS